MTPTVQAVRKALPWVVSIGTTQQIIQVNDPFSLFFTDFFCQPNRVLTQYSPLGSGVILDASGLVVTNYHVVRRASSIQVQLWDGTSLVARMVGYDIPKKKLTDNIRIAIGTAYSKFEKVHGQIIKRLDDLQSAIDSGNLAIFDPREQIGVTVRKMDRDLNKTLKPLTIDYKPSDNLVEFILEKYGNDLTKYIKNWNIETIQRLRDRVSSNAFSGYRASSLAEEIAADYGVSARKAKFLARQETSLMLSTFREGRYKEVGIEEYEWQTAGDSRVRDMHKHLNRKIFSWENPPIIDDYGHRGNPGEAFGCRCVAAPVL